MGPGYIIKPIDADGLSEAVCLIRDVFAEFVAPDCSPDGVETFEASIDLEILLDKLNRSELLFWGAYDACGRLAGVIAGQPPGHIKYLFVEKNCQRQVVARALLDILQGHYSALGSRAFTVNSSPYALEVYKKMGFQELGPEKIVDGIRFIPIKANI